MRGYKGNEETDTLVQEGSAASLIGSERTCDLIYRPSHCAGRKLTTNKVFLIFDTTDIKRSVLN